MAANSSAGQDFTRLSLSLPLNQTVGQCLMGAPVVGYEKTVCLGPGEICPGGRQIGGTGDNPLCKYPANPAGYVVLLFLISLLMLFERLKHWLMHSVPRSYMPVMHAMFGELSSLGFVSLVAFFFEYEPPGNLFVCHLKVSVFLETWIRHGCQFAQTHAIGNRPATQSLYCALSVLF